MIYNTIQGLIRHGIRSGLIAEEDELVVRNQLMDLLHLTDWEDCAGRSGSLDELLDEVVDYACANGIIEQTAVQRDLFDTRVMGVFTGNFSGSMPSLQRRRPTGTMPSAKI